MPDTKKAKPHPLTVAQVEADLVRAKHLLIEAQRAQEGATARLSRALSAGDAEDIAACRQEKKDSLHVTQTLASRVDDLEVDLAAAQVREAGAANRERLANVTRLVVEAASAAALCEDSIVNYGARFTALRAALLEVQGEFARCAIQYDPYLFPVVSVNECRLSLETGGVMGRAPTLDTPEQLRASGRASLRTYAENFQGVLLRNARLKFGDQSPHEA